MATGKATRFVELGLSPPLAIELAKQITAGVGVFRRLAELGMEPSEAKRIANRINGTIISNNRMTEKGIIPRVLRELNSQLASGGGVPSNTVAPALSTTSPAVGTPVTVTTGTWTNSPTGYAYQWYYADTSAAISGATANSYTPVSADTGHTLLCRVTASNASGAGTPANSNTSGAVAAASFAPTNFAIAPSMQHNPNTSTLTMRAVTNLTGYISGNTMTITANDGPPLLVGDVILTGAAAGTKILRCGTAFGATTGSFTVDISQTVGSSGSPVSFTVDSKTVTGISDLKGFADLTSLDGIGPRLMTDAAGRKFLRFLVGDANKGSWLRSLTATALDSYNATWMLVGRFHQSNIQSTLLSYGLFESSTGANVGGIGIASYWPVCLGRSIPLEGPANANKLFLGAQLQVFSSATATNTAVGTTTSTVGAQVMVNEQSAPLTVTFNQVTNKTGFELGKLSTQNTGIAASAYTVFDLYELNGWVKGEMGNISQMPTRVSTAQAAAMSNFAISPITDSVIVAGDSRSVNGSPVGQNVAIALANPGASYALPGTTRVLNIAVSGQGIGVMWQVLDRVHDSHNVGATSPLNSSMMLGGGHDMVSFFIGINDTASLWPNTGIGGRFASQSLGIADDAYNGADYTVSYTATIANNAVTMSATGLSPTGGIYVGTKLTISGTSPGLAVFGNSTGAYTAAGPWTLNANETPGVSAVAGTGVLSSYQKWVQAVLSRGFKVRWGAEPIYGGGDTAARAELNTKIIGSAITDATAAIGSTLAANLGTYDITQIPVSGQKIWGANYTGSSATDPNWLDTTHPSPIGIVNLVSGGDDPTKGIAYAITH